MGSTQRASGKGRAGHRGGRGRNWFWNHRGVSVESSHRVVPDVSSGFVCLFVPFVLCCSVVFLLARPPACLRVCLLAFVLACLRACLVAWLFGCMLPVGLVWCGLDRLVGLIVCVCVESFVCCVFLFVLVSFRYYCSFDGWLGGWAGCGYLLVVVQGNPKHTPPKTGGGHGPWRATKATGTDRPVPMLPHGLIFWKGEAVPLWDARLWGLKWDTAGKNQSSCATRWKDLVDCLRSVQDIGMAKPRKTQFPISVSVCFFWWFPRFGVGLKGTKKGHPPFWGGFPILRHPHLPCRPKRLGVGEGDALCLDAHHAVRWRRV